MPASHHQSRVTAPASPGGLRLAIARGLLRAEQHVSPLQPRPSWLIERADLLDYEERMAERGAKRGPKPRCRA